jgi:predicted AAA+ superfamily ATPase
MKRYLEDQIFSDALNDHKMAFLYGPRQVGKTTLAKNLLTTAGQKENYYTWEDEAFKRIWIQDLASVIKDNRYKDPIVVLDEIHKDRKWKNKLKGLFDVYQENAQIIVTGSARLDFFRKSGDSLLGRYIPYRIHPFSLGETVKNKLPPSEDWLEHSTTSFQFLELLNLGGFPEPLLSGSQAKSRRWGRLQKERLIQEDLRDLSNTKNLHSIDLLSTLLTDRVGSQLSFKSLEEDLKCSFTALRDWLRLLEGVYYSYQIKPYSKNIKRSLLKEPKLYLYNWALIENESARYENMIASHLLKSCHYWTDCAFGEFDLYYLRDKDKREVDFFVTKDKKPYLLLEVKSNSHQISPSTYHFYEQTKPRFAFQLVRGSKSTKSSFTGIRAPIQIMRVEDFLSALV